MRNVIQRNPLNSTAGRATVALALSASGMSLVSTWLVPLGFWRSLAWAVLACASGLWALEVMNSLGRPIRNVIAWVEAEPPGAVQAPTKQDRRGAFS